MRNPAFGTVILALVIPLWVPSDWSGASDHVLPLEKNCTSATDGCRVCKVAEGRVMGCSFPGIACSRGDWQCSEWSKETPQSHPPAENR
jgi:hypothetical protein